MTDLETLKRVVDIYNQNQKRYKASITNDSVSQIEVKENLHQSVVYYPSIYDFLYNPKWKFAETFFKTYWTGKFSIMWQYSWKKMVLEPNPIRYLKGFLMEV